MQGLFQNIFVQFRDFYKNLTPVKRMSMIAVSLIVLATAGMMVLMMAGTDYIPVLTNVPPDQTAVVVDKLQAKNIPFRVQDGGKTITVPKELLHSTQMALMSEIGSGKIGTIGFELFDKQDFGTSSYAQRINYQRALQGELTRAINTLDAVKRSKIMLALPPKKTFLEEGGVATASVVVELHAGKTLSEDQVRGIRHLVGSSVEGLDPDKVTVVDSRGKMLSRPDGASGGSSALAETKTKMEHDIEDRVESILAKVVGQGKVMVRVNAQLNHRQTQTSEESVDPEKTALLASSTEEEKLDGARTNPTGVPGSRANIPGAQEAGQVGFSQNVAKELKTQNYVVPKTVRNTSEAAGGLERITVSVLVDGISATKTNDKGESEETWVPRTPEEIAKFDAIVKNAIGFSEQRGDSVKIETMKFEKEDFTESDKWLTTVERKKLVNSVLKWLLLGGVLAAFFLLVIRPFMRWVTDSFQDSVEDLLPRTIEELEQLQSVDNSLPGMSSALPVLEESLDPDKAESELLRERIMTLMGKDEEKASGAFSLWLIRKDT
jgi:flagellar M-ring protein FliF